ncbi:DUF4755 domain-containing protein [Massilia forsythiae]|uniref:DUF4755 domain-containing protein n=1 Tax=Massilia forsythiae TaxID=2728020 RepID=A0A7Z2ZUC5_9BURK|nr:DUF4755 domain-containing protein [Massilia forsythiae]QJE02531.1 DUF4755 domain-containing protein [Massilia forsythiae]
MIVSALVPFADGGFAKLVTLAVGWAPAGFLAWFAMNRAKRRQALHQQMLAAIGVAGDRGFDHAEEGTGIALNQAKRVVAVLADGSYREYRYEQVRQWSIREERAGAVVPAFGVASGVAAAGANARMARDALANTGLFLTVKDVDRPGWRVAMKDARTRERWMELLRQEINEGGVAA